MILTREQVDEYEKCAEGSLYCGMCSLKTESASGWIGCLFSRQSIIDTIRHYMAEAEAAKAACEAKDERIAELEARLANMEKFINTNTGWKSTRNYRQAVYDKAAKEGENQ